MACTGFTQSWLPLGTTWNYSGSCFYIYSVTTTKVVGVKTIKGILCDELQQQTISSSYLQHGPNEPSYWTPYDTTEAISRYVYQENRSVFLLEDSSFIKVFDFASPVGTVWGFPVTAQESGCDSAFMRIEFKGDTVINGFSHHYIKQSYSGDGRHFNLDPTAKIEGIGSLGMQFFQPFCIIYEYYETLSCFKSNNEEQQFGTSCDLNVGITEGFKDNFTVFPNPAINMVSITGLNEICTVKLTDAAGKLVKQLMVSAEIHTFSIGDLPVGVYWLQMRTGKGLVAKKLIKIKE